MYSSSSHLSVTAIESALTTSNIQVGSRVIFLPDQPGVYLALRVEPNEIQEGANGGDNAAVLMSDTQSTSSYASSIKAASKNYKSLALKKHVFAADCFLDMEKLPRKTQQILTKFEMIVIAKVLAVEE